jgi:hypothetical protein
VLVFILDSIHILNIHSRQSAAQLQTPPKSTKRIYIASQHWNTAPLLRDRWNKALLDLVQELGPENVFVTIYESGSFDDTKEALRELDTALGELQVKREITLSDVSHKDEIEKQPAEHGWIKTPSGKTELRRIPFLATLRNRLLEPLQALTAAGQHFDLILFLNDVVFTPHDVLTLLDTNNGSYAAACSLDFQTPPAYYDTFALRDSSGHETATQTWPYFRSWASRHALQHFDPVPVASCWNGMVAMPVQPFVSDNPLRFRGVDDGLAMQHVEGSECCLVHADNPLSRSRGVWVNPRVKVGYSGEAYDKCHGDGSVMSPFALWKAVWWHRVVRWFTSPVFKEMVIRRRVREWGRGRLEGEGEPGVFCLVNEMQIMIERGWKHV